MLTVDLSEICDKESILSASFALVRVNVLDMGLKGV
jgi:hypothetical protein